MSAEVTQRQLVIEGAGCASCVGKNRSCLEADAGSAECRNELCRQNSTCIGYSGFSIIGSSSRVRWLQRKAFRR